MNLYDRIKPGKRRRGWGGAVFLAAACVVLVICIGTIGWAARYHQRYRRFSTDFAASVEVMRSEERFSRNNHGKCRFPC